MNEIVIFVTTSSEDEAQKIASELIMQKLAACVQFDEVKSVYQWRGKIEQESETRLMIKTIQSKFEAIQEQILKLHSYDCPEIIALPIMGGNQRYLQWIGEVLQ